MNIDEQLQTLKKNQELFRKIAERFPDAASYPCRWRTVWVSPSVNLKPEGVYTSHSCGCCNDAPLYAWFFCNVDGEKIYSHPPYVTIGQKVPYDSLNDQLDENWEDVVRSHAGEKGLKLLRNHLAGK